LSYIVSNHNINNYSVLSYCFYYSFRLGILFARTYVVPSGWHALCTLQASDHLHSTPMRGISAGWHAMCTVQGSCHGRPLGATDPMTPRSRGGCPTPRATPHHVVTEFLNDSVGCRILSSKTFGKDRVGRLVTFAISFNTTCSSRSICHVRHQPTPRNHWVFRWHVGCNSYLRCERVTHKVGRWGR